MRRPARRARGARHLLSRSLYMSRTRALVTNTKVARGRGGPRNKSEWHYAHPAWRSHSSAHLPTFVHPLRHGALLQPIAPLACTCSCTLAWRAPAWCMVDTCMAGPLHDLVLEKLPRLVLRCDSAALLLRQAIIRQVHDGVGELRAKSRNVLAAVAGCLEDAQVVDGAGGDARAFHHHEQCARVVALVACQHERGHAVSVRHVGRHGSAEFEVEP